MKRPTKPGSMRWCKQGWKAAKRESRYWDVPLRKYIRETYAITTREFHGKALHIAKDAYATEKALKLLAEHPTFPSYAEAMKGGAR